MKINITTDIRYALFYFFVVVCLGIFLRFAFVLPIPFEYNYRYVLHAHSHTAFLGWMYVLLSSLISREFVSISYEKQYRRLFYATQFSVIGMLFSFLFQGYGAISITFSSLFVILSYCFAYLFLKKWKNDNAKNSISYLFIKMGVIYLVLSSLGIWAIPFSIIKFGKDSVIYNASIAFFLHFQYNGWICSILIGLFIYKSKWEEYFYKLIKKVFYLFQIAVVGTLVVSWLGIYKYIPYYIIGGLSSFLWLITIGIIGYLYFFRNNQKMYLATLFLVFFILKICVMIIGIVLGYSNPIFSNPDLLIAYLHLNFLGVISIGLLYFLKVDNLLKIHKFSVFVYLFAFLSTELLIVYKGISVWLNLPFFDGYFQLLAIGSTLFLFPVFSWLMISLKMKKG